MQNNGSTFNSLAQAFDAADSTDAGVIDLDPPRADKAPPAPWPRPVRPVRPTTTRRASPAVEDRLDDLVDGYARDLEASLRRHAPGETLLAAGLLAGTLGAVLLLGCVGLVLPLPGFVTFVFAVGLLVFGLRVALRASARYLAGPGGSSHE